MIAFIERRTDGRTFSIDDIRSCIPGANPDVIQFGTTEDLLASVPIKEIEKDFKNPNARLNYIARTCKLIITNYYFGEGLEYPPIFAHRLHTAQTLANINPKLPFIFYSDVVTFPPSYMIKQYYVDPKYYRWIPTSRNLDLLRRAVNELMLPENTVT